MEVSSAWNQNSKLSKYKIFYVRRVAPFSVSCTVINGTFSEIQGDYRQIRVGCACDADRPNFFLSSFKNPRPLLSYRTYANGACILIDSVFQRLSGRLPMNSSSISSSLGNFQRNIVAVDIHSPSSPNIGSRWNIFDEFPTRLTRKASELAPFWM